MGLRRDRMGKSEIGMNLPHNVAVGKAVRELIELADADFTHEHWLRLRDELIQRYPLSAAGVPKSMTDEESRAYGQTLMPLGQYKGKPIDTVPLQYLDWLCREQESFYSELRRYLKSRRVRTEWEYGL